MSNWMLNIDLEGYKKSIMHSVKNQNSVARPSDHSAPAQLNLKPSETQSQLKRNSDPTSLYSKESNWNISNKRSSRNSSSLHDFSKISILTQSNQRLQPGIKINTPGDRYEQEADRISEQVMRMPSPNIQRKCIECEEEEEMIQTKSQGNSGNTASSTLMNQIQSTQGSGQALDTGVRSFMEPRFGTDFSGVRIHSDEKAANMNRGINARAFTVGSDIYFNQGEYDPAATEGKKLLAHELTHTLQQTQNKGYNTRAPYYVQRQEEGEPREVHPRIRLRQVRERLRLLRNQQSQSNDQFDRSLFGERTAASTARARQELLSESRSDTGARQIWGSTVAAGRIRQAVTVNQSGSTVILNTNIQLSYLALSDEDGRERARRDIPRISSAIRDVWQVTINSGEYAGITFRLEPTLTYLPSTETRSNTAFLIRVRGLDDDPSEADPVLGLISLAQNHLNGSRVIVVAHELAHLFGFLDTYLLEVRQNSQGEETTVPVAVGRQDATNRPDLLGIVDPVVLERAQREGGVSSEEVRRQSGNVRVWEEEASRALRVLGVLPPAPSRPFPDSENFDPTEELRRVEREGEGRLSQIRESRRRTENSLQWIERAEEIITLEREEQALISRLNSNP